MRNPKVSILVAAYNVGEWLEECLTSIRNQSCKDFECIVVDDCSTDETLNISKYFAQNDWRFKVIRHQVNQGLPQARRTAFLYSRGQYIWYVDGDDCIADKGLENIIKILDRDKCEIARGRYQTLEMGKLVNKNATTNTPAFSNCSLTDLYTYISPNSIWLNVFQREFLERCDVPFYPDLNLGEDLVYCSFAFAKARKISVTDHCIYTYRVRQNSYTQVEARNRRYLEEARSHVKCHEHLREFPIVALDFAYRYSSYRMRWVEGASRNLPAEEAEKVIETYQKIYQCGFDQYGHALVQKNRPMGWNPEKDREVFLFGLLMKNESASAIRKYYRETQ